MKIYCEDYERPLEPPEYNEPEELQSVEELEVDLDGIQVKVDTYGDIDYIKEWDNPLDLYYSEEYPGLAIANRQEVSEYVLDLLKDTDIPIRPGRYSLEGSATLIFKITDIFESREYHRDEDDDIVYDSDIDIDDVEVKYMSNLSDIQVTFNR